jgi:4-hydroxy-4-methyl-2-oxoglutarate aldolase
LVVSKGKTVSKETLENLKKIGATTAWGTLGRVMKNEVLRDAYRMVNMRPLENTYTICGPAMTVSYLPVDPINSTPDQKAIRAKNSEMLVKIMETIKPGDVLVLAAQGRYDAGLAGEAMNTGFKAKGTNGVVVDAGERDVPILRTRIKHPIFLSGRATMTSAGWYPHEDKIEGMIPNEINVPVKCDGVMVRPGDFIIGDEDGVIVIPIEYTDQVGRIGAALEEIEELQRQLIAKGEYVHHQPMDEEVLKKYGLLEKYKITREAQV